MRRDLIFKYFSSIINRLELISRHLRGEMLDNDESESIVIAENSVDLSDQDIEILHFFLEEIAIKTNQVKKLLKFTENDN